MSRHHYRVRLMETWGLNMSGRIDVLPKTFSSTGLDISTALPQHGDQRPRNL